MNKQMFLVTTVTCLLLGLVSSGIAQNGVPIEEEPMHRLKFENQFVRVFDVLIPAGGATMVHVHRHDAVTIRLSDSQIIDEALGGEKSSSDVKFGMVSFTSRPLPQTHRVVNSGKTDLRLVFIEILAGKSTISTKPFPILSDGHLVLIDNDLVRVNRLVLKPGESSKLHTHQLRGLGITLFDSKIEVSGPDGTSRKLDTKAGDHVWQNAGTTHTIKNIGTTVFEAIDIELK
jgi:mannose-6-phosphate isomerase-like protein (cupin superfamily)